ncbi:lysozyme inhibitor LprI family protein [uncultured Dokdonia sp.]|uniref:lysozyme inhibitor LprI family protein n=1 Tax=uncultured Dokdonia sp. TaxID=575653 RepID=UPI0026310EAE|nr:lysozyme inhibitor LprI family protein [uncultured Dokdonia sp.]
MKNLFLSLVFLVTISSYGQDQKHSIDIENNRCIEQATPTTIGSINCEKQALEAWQAEMETVLQKLQSNPKLLDVALLEASQATWSAFHNAQVQLYYSYYQKHYQGGSLARAAALSYEKRHLRERVLYLTDLYEEISGD